MRYVRVFELNVRARIASSSTRLFLAEGRSSVLDSIRPHTVPVFRATCSKVAQPVRHDVRRYLLELFVSFFATVELSSLFCQ